MLYNILFVLIMTDSDNCMPICQSNNSRSSSTSIVTIVPPFLLLLPAILLPKAHPSLTLLVSLLSHMIEILWVRFHQLKQNI